MCTQKSTVAIRVTVTAAKTDKTIRVGVMGVVHFRTCHPNPNSNPNLTLDKISSSYMLLAKYSITLGLASVKKTRCSAIAERPRCKVCYSFRQK